MFRYEFKIEAVPASRPRVTRFATFYPKRYTAFREAMGVICDHTKFNKIGVGPIKVETIIYLPMPKSWSKKKKQEMNNGWKDNTSDNDNYEKSIWDSLNGKAWEDDRQIVWNETKVKYSEEGSVIVVVTPL